jgi:hypothetical protein
VCVCVTVCVCARVCDGVCVCVCVCECVCVRACVQAAQTSELTDDLPVAARCQDDADDSDDDGHAHQRGHHGDRMSVCSCGDVNSGRFSKWREAGRRVWDWHWREMTGECACACASASSRASETTSGQCNTCMLQCGCLNKVLHDLRTLQRWEAVGRRKRYNIIQLNDRRSASSTHIRSTHIQRPRSQ